MSPWNIKTSKKTCHASMSFILGPIVKHTLGYIEKSYTDLDLDGFSNRHGILCRSIGRYEISDRHKIVAYSTLLLFPYETSGPVFDIS